jgi:dipeptidyl aminopeptidase/acylaminoacyl peptidase
MRTLRLLVLSGASLILTCAPPCSLARSNPEWFEDYLQAYREIFQVRATVATSPDGRFIAFDSYAPVFRADEHIRLLDTQWPSDGAKTIALGSSPAFSPDGRFLAYLSSQSGAMQIWVYDVAKRSARRVSDVQGGIESPVVGVETEFEPGLRRISWSPDSIHIAFIHTEPRNVSVVPYQVDPWARETETGGMARVRIFQAADTTVLPVEAILPNEAELKDRRIRGGASVISRLLLLKIGDGSIHAVPTSLQGMIAPIWSSSDPRTVFVSSREYVSAGFVQGVRTVIASVDVFTGASRKITTTTKTDELVGLSPEGTLLTVLRNDSTGVSPTLSLPRLYVIEPATGQEHELLVALPMLAITWIDKQTIAVAARDGLESVIFRFSALTGSLQSEERRKARVQALSSGGAKGSLILFEDTPASPLMVLRQMNAESLLFKERDPFNLPANYYPLGWNDDDGNILTGMLIVPQNSGAKPPIIVDPYPGQANWAFPANLVTGTQILLRSGYAVLRVNTRTPHSWPYFTSSEKLGLSGSGKKGVATILADINGALQQASRLDVVNVEHACGFGHSSGGGTLAQYITQSNKLKCAAIDAPVGVGWWTSSYLGRADIAAQLAGGPMPWQDPALYSALDALIRVDHADTPTLLAVGKDDWFLPIDTVALFNALRFAGKPTTLLVYPNQGHIFDGAAERDFWSRKLEFFNSYLSDRPRGGVTRIHGL